ncbi:MAG: thermonuclease family protein [Mariprofundales bacterium]|nr:thermonuclease family protein [Mariprofundales bacterium]
MRPLMGEQIERLAWRPLFLCVPFPPMVYSLDVVRKIRVSVFGLWCAALLLGWGGCADAGTLSLISNSRWVTVDRVYDGDTFRTIDGERVRLLGLNTPEVQHRESAAEPLGDEATRALRTLIAGQVVRLEFDREKVDIYNRTLAQVYNRRGEWINGVMVEQGWAHVYTFVPNLRWAKQLLRLERKARRRGAGIWSSERWQILEVGMLNAKVLGQFRLVTGVVSRVGRRGRDFYMGGVHVTVPKRYRSYFTFPLPIERGDRVLVRGRVRSSGGGGWFVSLHAPTDWEMMP